MKKNIISVLLAMCLASAPFAGASFAAAAENDDPASSVKGDANCDGTVDMSDAVLIMQALSNPNKYGENGTAEIHLTEQGKTNADMDGDGLTVRDAQLIQQVLLGFSETTDQSISLPIISFYSPYDSGEKKYTEMNMDEVVNIKTDYNPVMSDWSGIGILFEFDSKDCPITLYTEKGHFTKWDTEKGSGTVENAGATYDIGRSGYIFWTPDELCFPEGFENRILVRETGGDSDAVLCKLVIYRNDDHTLSAVLKDASADDVPAPDYSKYLTGNGDVSSAASTSQRIALMYGAFCEKGETFRVDMAMGDEYTTHQKFGYYPDFDSAGKPGYSIFASRNYNQKTDDDRLVINGEKNEYTRDFSREDMESLDISGNVGDYDHYRHESAEIDFSDYETGSTGCITFSFGWKAEGENPLSTLSDFIGMSRTLFFYVGENGTGISDLGYEYAQQACETRSEDTVISYDSAIVKWHGKEVMSNLYDELRRGNGGTIPVTFKLSSSPDYDFEYNGRKLSEYVNANYSEYMTKLRDLMGYGNSLKYGEMLYTTGTPEGTKWTQDWYEDRIGYFGEELLSKYIADGEFLEEALRTDINELMRKNREACNEAENAYLRYISAKAVKQLDQQNIRYEFLTEPDRLVMYVTAEEFDSLSVDNVLRYGLDTQHGLTVDAVF